MQTTPKNLAMLRNVTEHPASPQREDAILRYFADTYPALANKTDAVAAMVLIRLTLEGVS